MTVQVRSQLREGRSSNPEWLQAADAIVRARLEGELTRLQKADPFQCLGLDYEAGSKDVRAAFLAATKQFHPSRFARRDRTIVRLANEVFLLIKRAYDDVAADEARHKVLERLRAREPSARAAPAAPASNSRVGTAGSERRAGTTPAGANGAPAERARTTPASPAARAARAATLNGAPQRPRRRSSLDEVLEREQRYQEEFEAAVIACEQGRFADARQAFHKLAAAAPHVRRYRVYLCYARGREHQAAGQAEQARAEYRRALDLDSLFEPARRALGDLPDGKGDRKGLLSRLFGR